MSVIRCTCVSLPIVTWRRRDLLREYFGGGWSSDRQQCPPMFATYGVRPGSIYQQVSEFRCMDGYKRYLTTDQTDLDVSIDGQEGTHPQIELSKVTPITRLLSHILTYAKRDDIGNDVLALGTNVDTDTAGNETSLQVCRESNVFKSLRRSYWRYSTNRTRRNIYPNP